MFHVSKRSAGFLSSSSILYYWNVCVSLNIISPQFSPKPGSRKLQREKKRQIWSFWCRLCVNTEIISQYLCGKTFCGERQTCWWLSWSHWESEGAHWANSSTAEVNCSKSRAQMSRQRVTAEQRRLFTSLGIISASDWVQPTGDSWAERVRAKREKGQLHEGSVDDVSGCWNNLIETHNAVSQTGSTKEHTAVQCTMLQL